MKNLRTFVCLAGGIALFGTGCGGAPAEANAEPAAPTAEVEQQQIGILYNVCWPALGVYAGPGTGYAKLATLYHNLGDQFGSDSYAFSANGDTWIRGNGYHWSSGFQSYGYVRWDGLCH